MVEAQHGADNNEIHRSAWELSWRCFFDVVEVNPSFDKPPWEKRREALSLGYAVVQYSVLWRSFGDDSHPNGMSLPITKNLEPGMLGASEQ